MGRRALWLQALLAVLLVAAAHGRGLDNGFHFDDGHSIEDNAWLRSLEHIPRYFVDVTTFSPLAENRSYRPVLLTTFAISFALGGGAPWGFQLITLLLHALGALWVGLLLRRLLLAQELPEARARAAGLFATAIFAVHPLLTEGVTYISARSSSMTAALMFACVLAYVVGREERRPRWIAAASLLLLLALGTKLIAITVPVVLLAWELSLGPSRGALRADGLRTWLLRLGPPAALAVGFTVLHELLVGPYARAARSHITPFSHLLTQTRVWLRYQGLYVWPEDLCADLVMRWSEVPWEGETARAILWAAALGAGAWIARRRLPVFAFGVLWFYVTLSPTNSLAPLAEPATEHRVYVALPGLLFATAALLERFVAAERRRHLAVVLTMVVLALGARAVHRSAVWKDEEALWGDTLRCAPENGRAHLNYGLALLARGDTQGARQSYERCAQLWPNWVFCRINLAVLAIREGRLQEAEGHIREAEALQPNNVYTRLWRGQLERARERWPEAAQAYAATLEVAPGHLAARQGLAVSLFEQGRFEEARPLLDALAREAQLDPDGSFAHGYLAELAGDLGAAEAAYLRAVGTSARARFNLAGLYHRSGRLEEAVAHYEALATSPSPPPDALFNYALALWARGDLERARAVRARLEAGTPEHPRLPELRF